MDKKVHINFWYVIAAILGMLWIQSLYLPEHQATPIPYSQVSDAAQRRQDRADRDQPRITSAAR